MPITNNLYNNYLAKNKPLRHPLQHLMVAFVAFLITNIIFEIPANFRSISLFLLFTYAPDIDGMVSIFILKKAVPEANETIKLLKNHKFKEAATCATIYHKKFNKLIIHNIVFFLLVAVFYLIAGFGKNYVLLSIFGAVLSHFIFDIADDVYQLGYVNNWLWPYFAIFNRKSRN